MSLPNAFLLISPLILFVTASLRLRSKTAYLLSLYLIGYACIVFISEAGSLLHALNGQFFLAAHFFLDLAAYALWRRCGQPALWDPFRSLKIDLRALRETVQKNGLLSFFAVGIAAIWLVNAYLIVRVPPNNYDGMTYHLSRVGYWLQHDTLAAWDTANQRQVTSPVNAELGILWSMLFSGSDQWAGFVQWVAGLACGLAIFGLARLLKASRAQALFAMLLWASFPQVLLQSVSVQNDLIVTSFFAALVYFLFQWVRTGSRAALLLSSIAFGLALGAKITAVMALPGLGIAGLFLWWQHGKPGLQRLLIWTASSLVGFLLLGSLTYVQNQLYYGNPISVPQFSDAIASTIGTPANQAGINLLILVYQAVDPGSVPTWAAAPLDQARDWLFQQITIRLNLPVAAMLAQNNWSLAAFLNLSPGFSEDVTWFGPLAFVLLIVTGLMATWQGIRQRDPLRLGLIAIAVAFFLAISITLIWSPYRGRYFILPVTLTAPLLAFLYREQGLRWRISAGVLIGLALCGAVYSLLNNPSKPIQGDQAFWNYDRIGRQTITNRQMEPVLRMVEKHVPLDARLATRLGEDDWDYPLFGPQLSRKLIQLMPEQLNSGSTPIDADFLLLEPRQRSFLKLPDGLRYLDQTLGWTLFAVDPKAKSSDLSPQLTQWLAGNSDPLKFYAVDERFAGKVGLLWLWPRAWVIEQYQGQGFLWLGEGELQGLRGYIWSEQDQPAVIEFQLEPGPGRSDTRRTVQFVFLRTTKFGYSATGNLKETRSFDGQATLTFSMQLQRGLNEFRLAILDEATIRTQPGNDQRPLLANLRRIYLRP